MSDITGFIVFDVNGKILRVGYAPSDMINIQANENEFVIRGYADAATQFIVSGFVADKIQMPVSVDKTDINADGIDTITVSDIPENCAYSINGMEGIVTDGQMSLTFDDPGEYNLKLSLFPYLDYSVMINAT